MLRGASRGGAATAPKKNVKIKELKNMRVRVRAEAELRLYNNLFTVENPMAPVESASQASPE
jgi:hypothetical protein